MSIDGIKLHIGGREGRQGWYVLDVNPAAHVDHVGNCNDLSFLDDASCSEVYASHVLEHLEHFPSALNRRDSQPLSPRRIWGN